MDFNSLFVGVGKSFWHPNASRLEAEQLLKSKPPGSFVMRRSSKVRKKEKKNEIDFFHLKNVFNCGFRACDTA
jgi:hypothetical protein